VLDDRRRVLAFGPRAAKPPPGTCRFGFDLAIGLRLIAPDGGRENVEWDTLPIGGSRTAPAVRTLLGAVAIAVFARCTPRTIADTTLRPLAPVPTIGTLAVAAIGTLPALRPLIILLVVPAIGLTVIGSVEHVLVAILVIGIIAALAPLILEAGAAFAQHAEIMVGELKVIFGLDAIPGELRISRHALVFFKKLRRIATLAVVLAVAVWPSAEVLGPLPATTATAAALTIIDQMPTSLTKKKLPLWPQARDRAAPEHGAAPDPLVPVCAPSASRTADCVGGWDRMR
jgi:hypothetical protein